MVVKVCACCAPTTHCGDLLTTPTVLAMLTVARLRRRAEAGEHSTLTLTLTLTPPLLLRLTLTPKGVFAAAVRAVPYRNNFMLGLAAAEEEALAYSIR